MDRSFYVYFHRRNDTGEVFYVGKGRGNRAEDVTGRTHKWYKIACAVGRTVEYVKTDMTEQAALRLERDVIAALRRIDLKIVNVASGGAMYVPVKEPRSPSNRAQLILADRARVCTWIKEGMGFPVTKSVRWMVLTFGCSREELNDLADGKISITSDGYSLTQPRIQR
jgi:hypothetical protein